MKWGQKTDATSNRRLDEHNAKYATSFHREGARYEPNYSRRDTPKNGRTKEARERKKDDT